MKPEIEYVFNKLKRLRFDFNRSDFENFRSEYRYEPTLKRYVRKDDNDLFIDKNTFKPLEEELEYADKCHNLQEQLGCPLEVVEKAIKSGIYNSVPEYIMAVGLVYINNFYGFMLTCFNKNGEQTGCYPTSEYKKTWWLKADRSE